MEIHEYIRNKIEELRISKKLPESKRQAKKICKI